MKQILLFDTAINTSNLGDEIIYDDCKKGLSGILDNALVFRLGTHVSNYSAYQLLRKEDRKIERLCDWSDYKFICGTNLLSDNLKGVNPQWMLNPINARLYTDSILVGVGKISDYTEPNRYTKKLYNKILSKKYKHSVRDEDAKRVLEDMGFSAINTGCPTLWGFTEEKCKAIPTKKAKNVVFSVSGYYKQRDPEKDKRLIGILKKNYEKCYLWVQTVIDEKYFNEINDSKLEVTSIYSLNKYKEILSTGDVDYIGTRLHGGVYALQNGCRSLVISIDQRARGFHRDNNLPILERDEIEKLYDVLNSEWETNIIVDREAISEFLNQFQ